MALEGMGEKLKGIEPPSFDFSNYDKQLEMFRKKTADELGTAVRRGLISGEKGMDLLRKALLKKIKELGGQIGKNLNASWGGVWESLSEQSLGLDEQALEAEKLSRTLLKGRTELQRYADYVRQTGNDSEYATQKIQEMTNSLIEQEFARLDPTQQQQLIDQLEQMGDRGGNAYAKALAIQLKDGTKKAVDEANTEAQKAVLTEDQILSAIENARRNKQDSGKKKREIGIDWTIPSEVIIDAEGQVLKLTAAEAQAYEQGSKGTREAVLKAKQEELRVLEEQNERALKLSEELRKKEADLEAKRFGKTSGQEQTPQDSLGMLDTLEKTMKSVLSKAPEQGASFYEEFHGGFGMKALAQPISVPMETLMPKAQLSGMELWDNLKKGIEFASVQAPVNLGEALGNGLLQGVNPAIDSIGVNLTTALGGLVEPMRNIGSDLGKGFGESFSGSITANINLDGLVTNIYNTISAKLVKEIQAAAGI